MSLLVSGLTVDVPLGLMMAQHVSFASLQLRRSSIGTGASGGVGEVMDLSTTTEEQHPPPQVRGWFINEYDYDFGRFSALMDSPTATRIPTRLSSTYLRSMEELNNYVANVDVWRYITFLLY
ncbi:hypothetical protein B0J17DRAFT_719207 [Rhizoctonia solani]|nr:hypothetical protein B0J17DRAFT_719207 [Rhizoctonia solani]